ncbi:urease accessory protein UreH [Anoxybacillus ayderensis]|uniref:urease accessory protein UreH n=1 Tax=Anoxybacillus ayderensis TaxID=265546 RepID=UPI000A2676EE|nr:urease accessory protein UreH [Anoxybacillus ayderensis]OSX55481.1 urease accessory protein UreH [Anoxybacillus ayderensis]
MSTVWPTLFFGFILGIKHATEPDHVIAVSTIASRTKKLSLSSLAGIFWGIGHTATLFVLGMIVIGLEQQIPETAAMWLELAVGVMIVVLGITSFRSAYVVSSKKEVDISHLHLKSTMIGIVHGLAGSAGMVLLTLTTVDTRLQAVLFILIFGVGTIMGMMLFTTFLGLPFIWMKRKQIVFQFTIKAVSLISIVYGLYYMYRISSEIIV